VEISELRERVGRAEAERDQARAERERVEREVAEVRAELTSWAAGGPLVRALRAFLRVR
jgi:FtsZ-binding cell division protein ZapB